MKDGYAAITTDRHQALWYGHIGHNISHLTYLTSSRSLCIAPALLQSHELRYDRWRRLLQVVRLVVAVSVSLVLLAQLVHVNVGGAVLLLVLDDAGDLAQAIVIPLQLLEGIRREFVLHADCEHCGGYECGRRQQTVVNMRHMCALLFFS